MGTTKFFAIMGCEATDAPANIALGSSVHTCLYDQAILYPAPPKTAVQLKTAIDDLVQAQSLIRQGGTLATIDRDSKLKVLRDMLQRDLLTYVNGLWMDNKPNLVLSGFPVNKEAEPHGAPETPVIKEIIDWHEPGTIKILLEPRSGSEAVKKQIQTYMVYAYSDNSPVTVGVLVLTTTDSHNLIVSNVHSDVAVYYAVQAYHGKQGSELSGKVKHTKN